MKRSDNGINLTHTCTSKCIPWIIVHTQFVSVLPEPHSAITSLTKIHNIGIPSHLFLQLRKKVIVYVRIIEKDSVRHIIRRQPQITLPVLAYPGVHHVRINQMVDIHLFQCSLICVFKCMEPGIRKHPEITKRIILLYTEKNGFNAGFFIVRSSYIMFLIVSSFLCIGKELP